MRLSKPTWVGTAIGGAIGLFSLVQPTNSIPAILMVPVQEFSASLRDIFMPNADPMAAFVFAIPLMVLLPALLGGVVGSLVHRADDK